MSELGRVTKLYQSNFKTLQTLQTQLSKLQTKLDTFATHEQLIGENQELSEKSSQLTNQLIRLQLMRGHWHVPLPDTIGPQTTHIVFPQKRACEVGQSESEPSPKLDKRDATEKSRSSLLAEKGSRPSGAEKGEGDRGAEKGEGAWGAEKGATGKGKGKGARGASKPPEEDIPDISRVDFRIGKVLEVTKHPNADTLFIEKVDCGDGGGRVRQVVSGLVGKIPQEQIQDRTVVVCCNLKPREMRSVLSEAMVMCACMKDANETTEFIDPPPSCSPGEPIIFEGFPHKPDTQLNPKRKIIEKVLAELNTDSEGVANYRGAAFLVVGKGVCRAKTLRNTIVK